ncbi:MAG: hypothetical protein MHM6MM_000788 [Cercozoa sp. M6MM]
MKTVTLEELRRHNSASDAWLSIHGEVYDVTEFAARHPGGQVIVEYFGTECTDQFELFHTPSIAKCWLKSLHVGKLVDPAEVPPSTQQYRALRQKLWEAGMFRAEPSYFIMKALAYLSILAIAYLCVTHDNYFVRVFLGGALLGLGWHQGAFIAHDACHLGVVNHCPRSKRGPTFWNRVIGWFQASVIFGISYNKWLREHNEHHAYTHRPLKDPQFIYLPVFLQSMKELQIKGAPQVNFLMRALVAIQKYTFLPLCVVIGRVNFYAVCLVDAIKYGAWMDIVGMAVYWSWVSLYFRHLHSSSELAVTCCLFLETAMSRVRMHRFFSRCRTSLLASCMCSYCFRTWRRRSTLPKKKRHLAFSSSSCAPRGTSKLRGGRTGSMAVLKCRLSTTCSRCCPGTTFEQLHPWCAKSLRTTTSRTSRPASLRLHSCVWMTWALSRRSLPLPSFTSRARALD